MRANGKTLTVLQAAEIIGCSDDTVRRLAHAGELHGFRLSDRGWMKLERESVLAFVDRRRRVNFHNAAKSNGKGRGRK